MKITYSEIFRLQQICDNLGTIIKIAEDARTRELEDFEVKKCKNLIENCGSEFYQIVEDSNDRLILKEIEKC